MLSSLSIRNFAIIDRLDVSFGGGLNVLTGETGAGKSIIIGALNAILGARGGSELVRAGAEKASVDAVFDLEGSPAVRATIQEMGFDIEDDRVFLSREISSAGKSNARIGGRPAAVGQLREVGAWLVDLHGQHEHQSLLDVRRHVDILDEWGGKEVTTLRTEVGAAFRTLKDLERERAALETDSRERVRMIDLYRFEAEEIAAAELLPGEEDELRSEERRLGNATRLAEIAGQAIEGADSSREQLALVARSLESGVALDQNLAKITESVNNARFEIEEASRDLSGYLESIEHDPGRLEEVQQRLDLIGRLKRKYGETIEEVINYGREAADKLDVLEHSEERGHELGEAIEAASLEFARLCAALTTRRTKVALEFSAAVTAELADLAMEKTQFEVQVAEQEPNSLGADRVEFLIAPNPGEPLRPLARIASGGEISRVMLAIKSAMARQEPLPTMVFDEIDVGVGGRTASVIADKLAYLARSAQVLCITHLPQIASRANQHFRIEKSVSQDRTTVSLTALSEAERVDELARMLGGTAVTETVLQHAREMLAAR